MNRVYTLYKIGQKAVFFNASLRQSIPELVEAIQAGEAMEDVYGKPYTDKDRATTELSEMVYFGVANTVADKIYRNLMIAPQLVSIVRAELLDKPDHNVYLAKLSPVINMINVGLFKDAADYLLSMIPDVVLTTEQLQRWAGLLVSANSIGVEV